MTETMTGVVQYATEPHAVELRELPVPEIDEDEVLLRVGAASVCGSDVHQYHGTQSWPVLTPVVLGHEFDELPARHREDGGVPAAARRRQLSHGELRPRYGVGTGPRAGGAGARGRGAAGSVGFRA